MNMVVFSPVSIPLGHARRPLIRQAGPIHQTSTSYLRRVTSIALVDDTVCHDRLHAETDPTVCEEVAVGRSNQGNQRHALQAMSNKISLYHEHVVGLVGLE